MSRTNQRRTSICCRRHRRQFCVYCVQKKNRNLLNDSVAVSRYETIEANPVVPQLKYGYEWVNADATISADLSLKDYGAAEFLELLYFT